MILYRDKRYIGNSDHPNDDWIGDADYVIDDNSELATKFFNYYPKYKLVTETVTEPDEDGNETIKEIVTDVLQDTTYTDEEILIIKNDKKAELSAACEAAIVSGFDFDGVHYSMSIEDQANIIAWMAVVQTGKSVPYHADGMCCRVYTAEEFTAVSNMAIAHKTQHTTYCNMLMRQVEEMIDVDEINKITYGTELNDTYMAQYSEIMKSLTEENT